MKKKTPAKASDSASRKPTKSSGPLFMQTEGFISRVNQDGTVILMHLSDVSSFFKLSKLTAILWPELRQVRSADALVAHFSKLMPKFADKLAKDIPAVLKEWQNLKLIEVSSAKESTDFDTKNVAMDKYELGATQSFDLDKIETEVLNESIYLDVFAGSDLRLKTDVKPVEGALAKISALEGIHYKWNDKARKSAARRGAKITTGRRTGLIAQQVLEQMPELVRADEGSGMLAVNYAKMNAYLVEAVKELGMKVQTLEKRLEKLSRKS